MSRGEARHQRRELRRHGRRRRRGGDGRAPVPVQRAARAVHATGDGTRRAWETASSGDKPLILALLVVIALGATMMAAPAQRYLDSNQRVDHLRTKAAALEVENEQLRQRREDLTDEEYVELLAREQQGLVRPGEVPYTLVPPEVDRPRISAPREVREPPEPAWYERAWARVRDWLA